MQEFINSFADFITGMGLFAMTWQMYVMWGVVLVLLFFGVVKQFEPLLLVPIAFGALIANIPDNGMVITQAQREVVSISDDHKVQTAVINDVGFISGTAAPYKDSSPSMQDTTALSPEERAKYEAAMAAPMQVEPLVDEHGKLVKGAVKVTGQTPQKFMIIGFNSGLFDFLGQGIKCEIFPALIFMGVGALTDFGPLLASPKALLLGAAAQGGVAFTFLAAMALGFSKGEASAIGIIAHSAAVHETFHHRKTAQDQDAEPSAGIARRKTLLLLRGDDSDYSDLPGCGSTARHVDAWQLPAGMQGDGAPRLLRSE